MSNLEARNLELARVEYQHPTTAPALRPRSAALWAWLTRDQVIATLLVFALIALYAPLHHKCWTLGGDGDVFLSVARSLARGQGYQFNGQPVAIIPPGWPWVLAAALQVTSRVATLKLIPAFCLIGFLSTSYWILRRYTTALGAVACVLVAAILAPVFDLAFLFYSDPLFALLCAAALWLALRINEGADNWNRVALLALLCAASVMVRWTGVLWTGVVAGALLAGEIRPSLNRRWAALLLCLAASLITFGILREALRVDPSQLDSRYNSFVSEHYEMFNLDQIKNPLRRLPYAGHWIGGLLWRVGVAMRSTRDAANIAGWAAIALLSVTLIASIRRRQWIGLAAFAYVAVLVVIWPSAMPRYILPLAPLVLLALCKGIARLGEWLPSRIRELRWLAVHYVIATVIAANIVLYFIEIGIAYADDVHSVHQAGFNEALVDAARWLNRLPRDEQFEVAISSKMQNFDFVYYTDGFRRALNLLTDRAIVTVPEELCREPDDELIAWARQHNVRYYLYQPPVQLIQHFHRTGWHGRPPDRSATSWRLYEFRDDGEVWRILIRPTRRWPTRIPGM